MCAILYRGRSWAQASEKLLIAKKWREVLKNYSGKWWSSQIHTFGQLAPQVSDNVAWLQAHHSHGAELRNHLLATEEPEELQECFWLTSWWSPQPSSTAASCNSGCLRLCDSLTFPLCSLTWFLFLILSLPGKASSVKAWAWGSCGADILVDGSVQFSHSVVSYSARPQGLQHAKLPCPSATPEACSNSCPLSRWCHSTISSSVVPFSSCLQSFPASGSFPISQAKVLEFQLQHQSFQWIFRTDFLEEWLVGSPCSPRDS